MCVFVHVHTDMQFPSNSKCFKDFKIIFTIWQSLFSWNLNYCIWLNGDGRRNLFHWKAACHPLCLVIRKLPTWTSFLTWINQMVLTRAEIKYFVPKRKRQDYLEHLTHCIAKNEIQKRESYALPTVAELISDRIMNYPRTSVVQCNILFRRWKTGHFLKHE